MPMALHTSGGQVLSAGDEAAGIEMLDEDMDDIARMRPRRMIGSMSQMSGAQGMVYMEYRYVLEIVFYLLWVLRRIALVFDHLGHLFWI